ncbi:chitinase [Oligoflexus tunisiensis]|uniref:chitinase n=1 Tax=Oligoflexus tunisiensis TaxID=708132 RepID=UPI000A8C1741|nr:chitinase [Oligoflexus tunisiensis]
MINKTRFRALCLGLLMVSGPFAFAWDDSVLEAEQAESLPTDEELAPNLPEPQRNLGDKLLIGYWHNFDNGSGFMKLRDVSPAYDVIHVAFAESVDASQKMAFTPYRYSESEFKADVAALQSRGKKVLISIGGANGYVHLDNEDRKRNFVESMDRIIRTYGFDGIDIDLEGASLSLNPGDNDFKRPVTPAVVHLIAAIRELHARSGGRLLVTMAPETFFVQIGYAAYGGAAGAYLPVIHALRGILTFIHVQHYNSGSVEGLDDKAYASGTADFHVALAEMLMTGFPIARNVQAFFPALRPDQVVIGLPATPQAAGSGFTPAADVQKALRYLAKGQSYGGQYRLKNASGYPGIRGIMTWSINWDAYSRFEFSTPHRTFLNSL